MRQNQSWTVLLCLWASALGAMPSQFSPMESEGREAGVDFSNDAHFFTLDLLADEDRYYTQGLHVFWSGTACPSSEAWGPMRGLGAALQAPWISTRFRLGQEVFTPNDVRASSPLVADDRPFVGWTHLDASQRLYFSRAGHASRLHLEAGVGMVGPASFADETQIWWHRVRRQSSNRPELDPDPSAGWAAQYGARGFPLRAQFTLNQAWAIADKRTRHGLGFDLGAEAQADFGNLYGNLGGALQLRAGRMTRSLYRPFAAGNGRGWEAFGFARIEGKAVAWNEVLTGAQSREVSPAFWLGQSEFGWAAHGPFPWPQISWAWSLWSRETKAQPEQPFQPGHADYRSGLQSRSPWFDHGFGTVRLAWSW